MRVLVTGGMGFVGYAVATVLVEAGHQVAVLTHTNRTSPRPEGAEIIQADIRDADNLQRALDGHIFDGVCHLAALTQVRDSFKNPLTYFDVNVGGTVNLLRTIKKTSETPPSIVFGSTAAIYGSNAEGHLTEESPANPDNPYAASKYAAELLLQHCAATSTIGATTLRCFAIAGACNGVGDPDDTRILPKALRVAAGYAPAVTINGDGSAVREFTHVVDIAEAYHVALTNTQSGTYQLFNVGSGIGTSVTDLIKAVEEETARNVPTKHVPPKPEPHTLIADSRQIRARLSWRPHRSTPSMIIRDAWNALNASSRSVHSGISAT